MDILGLSVSGVKGVGPKKLAYLQSMGIENIGQLIYYFPRDYEDRTKCYPIARLPGGEKAGVRARVVGPPAARRMNKNLSIIRVPVEDESGRGWAVWFNNRFTAAKLGINRTYDFYGRIDTKFGEVQIQNPDVRECVGDQDGYSGGIVPVYPKSGRLTARDFERFISNALEMVCGRLKDILTLEVRQEYGLEEINYCIKNIHFPSDSKSLEKSRRRLVFEELFLLQLGLLIIKKGVKAGEQGISFSPVPEEQAFLEALPYRLTDAQRRVWSEIKQDMEGGVPMNRLLQGDVGSGKTVIAVTALVKAIVNGYQGALMVPTEILAEQHHGTICSLLKRFDIRTELLIGSRTAKEKERIYRGIAEGDIDIVVGTHALIQDNLEFCNLGLVITDEQHRFGVRQRSALFAKGTNPDVLVMTATPIPRTLALILYGDMDVSIIDQMPPGRKTIETYVVDRSYKDRIYNFVAKQLAGGRQGYIVCPLIEESEAIDAISATRAYNQLVKEHLKDFKVELIHGKISAQEKEGIMKDFREGKIDVLVSTTVIEVGVDVPQANVMVVENAERFGLAQLHQLRGRVGRGASKSYCILINESGSSVARERMEIMSTTSDGLLIAEKDLSLRGPGDFFGIRQHGLPDLKLSSLPGDMEVLKDAQELAVGLLKQERFYDHPEWLPVRERIKLLFKGNDFPVGTI